MSQGSPSGVQTVLPPPIPAEEKPDNEKRMILAEVWDTFTQDPLGVQFLPGWFMSLLPRSSPLENHLPWMNFRVIRWLRSYLRPTMRVFEYGSGGSTLFVAPRVREMTSIEHDTEWHERIGRILGEEGISNCHLRLVPPEPRRSTDPTPYGPASYTSLTPHAAGLSFERYVRMIEEVPERSLDLVIVDGYARFSCVAAAIPKIRPGGFLLFDDTDLKKYRAAVGYLDGYPRTDFLGVTPFQRNIRQTTIWQM